MERQVCIEPGGLRICDYYIGFPSVEDVYTVRYWPFKRKLIIVTNNSIITIRGNNRDILASYEQIRLAREAKLCV